MKLRSYCFNFSALEDIIIFFSIFISKKCPLPVADQGFQKRGARFFFFLPFNRKGGGGDNFSKKKKETNHGRDFNIAIQKETSTKMYTS